MTTHKTYLPLILKQNIPVGIQTNLPNAEQVDILKNVGVNFTLAGGVSWSDYEPEEGLINISALDSAKNSISLLNSVGIDVMIGVQKTPPWARKYFNKEVPKEEFIPNFVRYVQAVNNIGNISHIQIYNEVDSTGGWLGSFGCWGIDELPTYIKILESLQQFRIKTPITTGIMATIDENNDECKTWSIEFNKHSNLVDEIFFHNYQYFLPEFANIDYALEYASQEDFWNAFIDRSARNMIETWEIYSEIYNKKLWITETNLISDITPLDPTYVTYENLKAKYIQESHRYALKNSVPLLMYYHYHSGWRNANIYGLPAWDEFIKICK